jgi:hypothetical protein
LTVLPDPYLSTSLSTANETNQLVTSGNFSNVFKDLMPSITLVNTTSISSVDDRLDLSMAVVPKFRHISFLPANISTDSINFRLSVINTNAIMHVGMLKADENVRAPQTLAELVNNTKYQVSIAKQGDFVEFKYSDLSADSEYNFFLLASEPVYGTQSMISKTTLRTKGNSAQQLSALFAIALTLLVGLLTLL